MPGRPQAAPAPSWDVSVRSMGQALGGLRGARLIALLALGLLASCQRCDAPVDNPQAPVEGVENNQEIDRKLTEAFSGRHLGASAAITGDDGRAWLVSGVFREGSVVAFDEAGKTHELTPGARTLGGVYPSGPGRAVALEFGGKRLLWLRPGPEGIAIDAELEVCQGPRLMEQVEDGARGWVLCQEADRRLVEVDVQKGEARALALEAVTPSDMELDASRERLLVADMGAASVAVLSTATGALEGRVEVASEPARLVAPPALAVGGPGGRLVAVLHANSPSVTLVDVVTRSVHKAVTLDMIPARGVFTPDGAHLLLLSPGEGTLVALDVATGAVTSRLAVPVGSGELAWAGGRALVSTGNFGSMQLVALEGGALKVVDEVKLGSAAGRITPIPGRAQVWLTGPQAGRVARYKVD